MYKQYEPEDLKRVQSIQKEILTEFAEFCNKHQLRYFLIYGTALGAVRHKGFIPWDDDIDVGMLREDYDKLLSIIDQFNNCYELLTPYMNKNYCSSVTHLQKKGTRFVSEFAQDLKCELGINIDIFVFDKITNVKKEQKKQMRKTYFWGRLLYLRGSGHPEIPFGGIKGAIAKIMCLFIHYFLCFFKISSVSIYKRLLANSTKYNHVDSSLITSFEDATPWKYIMDINEIFPLETIPFEDIIVPVPKQNHEILTRIYGEYMEMPPLDKRVNHSPVILEFGD